jgi:CBS domain-containing protein
MPYPVKHLIEGRPVPVTVRRDESIAKAWNLMVKHDFSQLPVVDSGNRPLGMVTHERILRAISNFRAQLGDLHVRDVMVDIPKTDLFDLEEDLFGLLKQLKLTNAVLIVDQQNILVGIVTSYDATEYFQNRAENLMRVEDIEAAVKDFILLAYTRDDGSRDEEQLAQAILHLTPRGEAENKQAKTFDDLTLGQYVFMLTSKKTWNFFEPLFKIARISILGLLEDIRNTRNELAHFRKEITVEQTDQLRFCAEWLARCWEEYQLSKAFSQAARLPLGVMDPKAELYQVTEESKRVDPAKLQEEVEVIAEETHPRESRYAALADWLQSQPGGKDEARLTFEEIEQIIGGSLPASAYEHRAWWANDSQGHPHSQLWLEVGWRTNYLNRTESAVTFVRIREREKAYIEFFSKLLAELREKANFQVKQRAPDGSNWVVCQAITLPGVVAQFNYSFARGKHFRVELYIDTTDKETTKQVFDNLYAQRAALESVLGELSWERIDDKRASRIALYHPGHITDDEEHLKAVREWAVEKMIALYNTLEPVASKELKEVLQS